MESQESIPATKADIELVLIKLQEVELQLAQFTFTEETRRLYSIPEAATLTGFKPFTLRQACNKRRITAEKIGHQWRISRDVVEQIREKGLPMIRD